jgi:hypothetical protein
LVLFGMQNRKSGPYMTAMHTIRMPVVMHALLPGPPCPALQSSDRSLPKDRHVTIRCASMPPILKPGHARLANGGRLTAGAKGIPCPSRASLAQGPAHGRQTGSKCRIVHANHRTTSVPFISAPRRARTHLPAVRCGVGAQFAVPLDERGQVPDGVARLGGRRRQPRQQRSPRRDAPARLCGAALQLLRRRQRVLGEPARRGAAEGHGADLIGGEEPERSPLPSGL